jgi:hypothetical protein
MILNLTLANSRAQFAMKTRILGGSRGIIDAAGSPPPCLGAGGNKQAEQEADHTELPNETTGSHFTQQIATASHSQHHP